MEEFNPGVPLDQVPAGTQAVIRQVIGGRGMLGRLATLGFTPGACLTVIQNFGHGPLIVAIRDARIALGRGEAAKIQVAISHRQAPAPLKVGDERKE